MVGRFKVVPATIVNADGVGLRVLIDRFNQSDLATHSILNARIGRRQNNHATHGKLLWLFGFVRFRFDDIFCHFRFLGFNDFFQVLRLDSVKNLLNL